MINIYKTNKRFFFNSKFSVIGAVALLIICQAPCALAAPNTTKPSTNKLLNIGVNVQPPFSMQDSKGNWEGLSIDLWKQIAHELNLKYKFKNLSFEDILKQTANGSIDATVSPITITSKREKSMNFTQPYYVTGFGIAVPNRGGGWLGAIKPFFSLEFLQAVISLAVILLIAGGLVWLVEKKHNKEEFGEGAGNGILAGVWWAAVTMTTVGYGDKAPTSVLGRLIGIVWMFAGVILISGFTAAITTSLTVNRMQGPVQGVSDLANARIGTVSNMNSATYLKNHHYIFKTYDSLEGSLEALKQGQVDAVVYDKPLLKYEVRQKFHGALKVLPAVFNRQYYGIALPKNSKLRNPVNLQLLDYINSDKWQDIQTLFLGSQK